MNCDEARERMVFFVDGEDDGVGEHVARCPACRALRDDVASERRLIGRALKPQTRRLPARRPAPPVAWWPIAVAAVALFAVAVVAVSFRPPSPPAVSSRPTPVRETPVEPVRPPDRVTPPAPEPKREPDPTPDPQPKPEPPRPEPRKPEPQPEPTPEPAKPEPVPTKPEKIVEVALLLEKGTLWKGTRLFAAGEQIQAKSPLRFAWGAATVHVKDGSLLTITGAADFTLDAGAVLVESAGTRLSIKAGGSVFANSGTRFLVEIDGKTASAQVFEGRVACGGKEIVAGERGVVKGGTLTVEPAKELYPAWMAKLMAKRVPVVVYDFRTGDKRWFGTAKEGALFGIDKDGLCYTGVEASEGILCTLPAKGEYWVTITTSSDAPITLRVRTLKPESTAFDYVIERPVTGRPVQVRIPLERFRSHDDKALGDAEKAHIFYVFTKEMSSKLRIDDLSVVELKE